MNKIFSLLAITLIVVCGCKKDTNDGYGNINNAPVPIQLDSFPLTVGNSWKYYTEIHVADSVGTVIQSDYYDNYWTVISDTFINGVPSSKISQLDSNYNGTTHLAYTYYANKSEGFFGMAVENMGSMFYLRTTANHETTISSGLQLSKNANTDTVFVPDSILWFLKFPSTLNDTWHTIKYGTDSNYQARKYERYQTVTTSAGTFDCLKTKIYFENNGQPDTTSGTIYQYFAAKGLVKETQFLHLIFNDGSVGTMNRTTKLVQVNF